MAEGPRCLCPHIPRWSSPATAAWRGSAHGEGGCHALGELIIVGTEVAIHSVHDGGRIGELPVPIGTTATAASVSPDGQVLIVGLLSLGSHRDVVRGTAQTERGIQPCPAYAAWLMFFLPRSLDHGVALSAPRSSQCVRRSWTLVGQPSASCDFSRCSTPDTHMRSRATLLAKWTWTRSATRLGRTTSMREHSSDGSSQTLP